MKGGVKGGFRGVGLSGEFELLPCETVVGKCGFVCSFFDRPSYGEVASVGVTAPCFEFLWRQYPFSKLTLTTMTGKQSRNTREVEDVRAQSEKDGGRG